MTRIAGEMALQLGNHMLRDVLAEVGPKPLAGASQNESRHYSERFSKALAHWLRTRVARCFPDATIMTPEARVATVYGAKSLDVGVLDARGYLLADFSIKTFNFKDRKTGNYRHNYTGRFYELLGEELDLRKSYLHATLVALVFLPADSASDSIPSSFAHAVRQYSKVLAPAGEPAPTRFEHVFIGLHDGAGDLGFFDASGPPPKTGLPHATRLQDADAMIGCVAQTVAARRPASASAAMPIPQAFRYA